MMTRRSLLAGIAAAAVAPALPRSSKGVLVNAYAEPEWTRFRCRPGVWVVGSDFHRAVPGPTA